jgi:signal transduction histidine kinase/DNA-binding response OmpR family regulator
MAKVLVVDDHPSNRELITTLLGYAQHRSIEAADGVEALALVRAEHPDLVICDILMPTMDGYQFVRQLRADPAISLTPVIFYTATFMEREARNLAAACGVQQVLTKPCEPEVIMRTVEAALNHHVPAVPAPDPDEFDREHLRLVTDKLIAKADELGVANQRLSALTDLNLELASERDPYTLLSKVCRGARELLGARYAVLRVKGKDGSATAHCATSGLTADEAQRLTDAPFEDGLVGQVMIERHGRRLSNPGGDPVALGLSAHYPPVHSAVLAPIVSLHRAYGWVLLVDKLGAPEFSADDERLLAIHAAQAGRIYENGSLYNAMKRSAEQLQVEVAERKRAADELRVANESLELRVEQRTADLRGVIEGLESFNRTVSHDLRGPLGGIAGVARLARESMVEGDAAKADHLLQLITARAATAEKLVSALLALARAGDVTLHRQRVDPVALVHEVAESLQDPVGAAPLPLVIGPMPAIDADPILLRQLFVNLISNALKFTAPAAQPRIEVGATTGPSQLPVFFVHDNGVGFEPQDAQRLFMPFQRLHGARFEGSGVGLSIAKRIVDRHGGNLWAQSTPGAGTTFFFVLGPTAPDTV